MEYLEAIAIKRLRPDNLPPSLQHLPAEADRVIQLHHATVRASKTKLALELPILSVERRAQVNAQLLHRLALACGLLEAWGGPRKTMPVAPPAGIEQAVYEPSARPVALDLLTEQFL